MIEELKCPKTDNGVHNFVPDGVRYSHASVNISGSGAQRRYYAHAYMCTQCLQPHFKPIPDIEDNSYYNVRFGATPGTMDEVGVPAYQRTRY